MAFCSNCGTEVAGAAFCPKCGHAQTGTAAAAYTPAITQSGMAENVSALLSYVLGWLTGIIFFLIDKRPFVRFHAAQSIVVFGALTVLRIAIGILFGSSMVMGVGAFGLMGALYGLISLVGIVLWILLMVKAYQGERFEIPIAAGIAKNLAGK